MLIRKYCNVVNVFIRFILPRPFVVSFRSPLPQYVYHHTRMGYDPNRVGVPKMEVCSLRKEFVWVGSVFTVSALGVVDAIYGSKRANLIGGVPYIRADTGLMFL